MIKQTTNKLKKLEEIGILKSKKIGRKNLYPKSQITNHKSKIINQTHSHFQIKIFRQFDIIFRIIMS